MALDENPRAFTGAPDALEAAPRPDVKQRFPGVFACLQRDAKRFPGGISAIARLAGRHPQVLANQLNPNFRHSAPSLEAVLDVIEIAGAGDTANAIALLAGRVAVQLPVVERSAGETLQVFLELVAKTAAANGTASAALDDLRIDAEEREKLLPLLDALIAVGVEFRAVVQG